MDDEIHLTCVDYDGNAVEDGDIVIDIDAPADEYRVYGIIYLGVDRYPLLKTDKDGIWIAADKVRIIRKQGVECLQPIRPKHDLTTREGRRAARQAERAARQAAKQP